MILNNSLKIIKKINCEKIIYFSSAKPVYKNNLKSKKITENYKIKPLNIYSKFKIYAEKKIKKAFLNNRQIIILRLFNIFNNKGNILIKSFKDQIKIKNKIIINGDGNQQRDFLHTKDISSLIKKIEKKN